MEHEFHRWLKRQILPQSRLLDVLTGVGDDAAVLRGSPDAWVFTTDTLAEGTHFDLVHSSLELVGRKSLAVNLSDLAAMAAEPVAAVLTFLLPRKFDVGHAQRLYFGIAELAQQFDVAIVGGDTNTWEGPLVIGATVLGKRPVHRSGWSIDGAKLGDAVVVSGEFGGSIHGRHLSFTPRVELALNVAEKFAVHAATDVSDSLSLDLSSIGNASRVGFDLDLDAIPVSQDVRSEDRETQLRHALTDGEDFELIMTVSQSEIERMMSDHSFENQLTVVGVVTDRQGELRAKSGDGGSWAIIEPQGYVH